ncbi:hypothetical protein G1C96_1877 [Bifidobacterium sp. DSM 109958]|uniref:DUF2207 domain-containing protein n=1 Tax=Bifidobacterium moraviense TaxID=2675323 RepID=A0A7Y0F3D1_9BIFI|nr:DUF2207 domain-containing protein [Bifidobacterium sp. DSM 109958]NMN01290.1 hypothetical protein [Bifidobacterium sp. DSM 109958]
MTHAKHAGFVRHAARAAIVAVIVALAVLAATVLPTYAVRGGLVGGADMTYETLDYDAAVQPDGRLTVTQHLSMNLGKRDGKLWKQLYQRYQLRSDNLTDITDISVYDVTYDRTYAQGTFTDPGTVDISDWNSDYRYQWYIADVTDGDASPKPYEPGRDGLSADGPASSRTVEIGWNIPAISEADNLRFDVTMTFHGAVTLYDDVASLQWEPVGPTNQVPIGTMTGTLRFPDGITASDSWGWLHYAGTSRTQRGANGELEFTAWDVRAGRHLDVVAAFDADAVHAPSDAQGGAWIRRGVGERLQTLKDDESRQEAAWRDSQRTQARIRLAVWAAFALVGASLAVAALIRSAISWRRSLFRSDIEYWRDPPDMSPACAARMADALRLTDDQSNDSRAMAATVLSLASKRAIAIYPGEAALYRDVDLSRADPRVASRMIDDGASSLLKGRRRGRTLSTSTIVLLPVAFDVAGELSLNLSGSEGAVLDLLKEVSRCTGSRVFDMRQMERTCRGWSEGYETMQRIDAAFAAEYRSLHATRAIGGDALLLGVLTTIVGAVSAVTFTAMGNLALDLVVSLPVVLLGAFACAFRGRTEFVRSASGTDYAGQVQGLYRYLVDFSDFTDRGAMDLALWDRYLVYATAFGISRKVVAALAKAYPQIADPAWLDDHASGSLLYWNYRTAGWQRGAMTGSAAGSGAAGAMTGMDAGASAFAGLDFGTFGSQISAGFADIDATIRAAAPSSSSDSSGSGGSFGSFDFGGSSGSFSGGGFGGSSGGSGGGSFGGR